MSDAQHIDEADCLDERGKVHDSSCAPAKEQVAMQQNSSMRKNEDAPAAAAGLQEQTISSEPAAIIQPADSLSRPLVEPVPAAPAELLLKAAGKQGHMIPTSVDAQRKLLGRLTHLHINGLRLQELHSLRLCPRLQVLYLYDNQLTSISSIASNRLLTHLYLQNNQLQQLAGLQDLALLQKVYLQNNCLQMVDNLTAACGLQELHVSDQHPQQYQQEQRQQQHSQPSSNTGTAAALSAQQAAVCSATGLQFQRESLQAISGSLRVLSAANCGISDISQIAVLQKLRVLDLSKNSISRLDSLQPVLQALQQLRVLDIRYNPCLLHELRYRDYVILLATDALLTLDGEDISASHRAFLLGLHLNKLQGQRKTEQQQHQQAHQQQLVGKRLDCMCTAAATGVGGGKPAPGGRKLTAPGVGLNGTSVTLHALKAPAVRPTAVAGFDASSARMAAVLAGPTHPGCSGRPLQEL